MLPSYRPSPDYETLMRTRIERMAQQNLQQVNNVANISHAQVYANPELMAYSQPEMGYAQYVHQGGERPYSHSVYGGGGIDIHHHVQYRPVDRSSSLIIHPTYSTPELHSQGLSSQFSTSENLMSEALLAQYKPPPPYPRPSSSTPDLATTHTPTPQARRGNNPPLLSGGSPDLVSRRGNLSNAPPALVEQSRLDQSMENLAFESQKLNLNSNRKTATGQAGGGGQDMAVQTPMMNQLLISSRQQQQQHQQQHEMALYENSPGNPGGEGIYVNTAGSGDYANVSAILASESGAAQHYVHYDEQLGQIRELPNEQLPGYPGHHQVAAAGLDNSGFELLADDSSVDLAADRSSSSLAGRFISHHHTSSLDSSVSHDSRMFPTDSETEEVSGI